MMRRLLWLGVGIAVGAVVARQVTRTVQAYSPGNLVGSARNSAAGLWESMRDFVADVREGMAEREAEIRAAFEEGVSLDDLDGPGHADLAGYDSTTRDDKAKHDRYDDNPRYPGARHDDAQSRESRAGDVGYNGAGHPGTGHTIRVEDVGDDE